MKHEPDLIPDLSLTSITDRSESSSLGKAVVVRSGSVFCLNCASRLGEKLPLSLLEVSTLAHGLCTLASYTMWWFKPLNIDEPTWIPMSDKHAQETLALMQVLCFRWDADYRQLLSATQNNYVLPQHFDTQRLPLALRAAMRYRLSVEDFKEIEMKLVITCRTGPHPRSGHLFWAVGLGTALRMILSQQAFRSSMACCIFSAGTHSFLRRLAKAVAPRYSACHVVRSSYHCTFCCLRHRKQGVALRGTEKDPAGLV